MALLSPDRRIAHGLGANLSQFALLVLTNVFVGGMVGLERAVLPLVAEREFGIASKSAVLSFLITFGVVKALANLFAGATADRVGRRRLLIAGWLVGLPVPAIILLAPSWTWIVAANLLLGINQGLCWSMTVVMKLDLAGPRRRGLAVGLNEFAGYGAVAAAALLSGYLASAYGLRTGPFSFGLTLAATGLVLSVVGVRDTRAHVQMESRGATGGGPGADGVLPFAEAFARVSWRERRLFGCTQAGLVTNFNDGMAWGLLPLFFAAAGLDLPRIGILAAAYPAVWGISQLGTGALSDRWGRRGLIVGGMLMQAAGIWVTAAAPRLADGPTRFALWMAGAVLLGLGTGLVYPTLIAAVSDAAQPSWRATAVGVYRLWRDLGFAVGAVVVGVVADRLGAEPAIVLVGGITFLSGLVAAVLIRRQTTLGLTDA